MTKIFTMTHKRFLVPQDSTYIPLHVGKAGSMDLGYMGDDSGDSISELNVYYGELTGIYWIWKNYTVNENIGVCHYRRFFANDQLELLSEKEYDRILMEYDIMTSKAIDTDGTYWETYAKAHNIRDLKEEARIIERLYPEDYPIFCKVMEGSKHYFGNLMAARREIFDAYCSWLFPIFFELEKVIDVEHYDAYHKRVFGFLSEQLLMVWVQARNLKVYESRVIVTSEKAETVELKLAMQQLIKMNQVSEARQLYYEIIKVRPDLPQESSDLKQEIFIIEQILYICEVEKQAEQAGILAFSHDLPELIEHYYRLVDILKRYQNWSEEDMAYLRETYVTELAIEIIGRNSNELDHIWQSALEMFSSIK